MRVLVTLLLLASAACAFAQSRPRDIDPNTRIQGGADVRSSGANAGTGASSEDRIEPERSPPKSRSEPRVEEQGERDQDKPTSERKPRERDEDTLKPATRK